LIGVAAVDGGSLTAWLGLLGWPGKLGQDGAVFVAVASRTDDSGGSLGAGACARTQLHRRFQALKRRLRQEDGIALVMALGMMLVLSIMVFAMISYTTSGQRSAKLSSSSVMSTHYAEAGTNAAYSLISSQNAVVGGNPAAANLLGCNGATGPSDISGPSNCTSPTPKVFCLTGTSCTVGSVGSVSVYGFFSGTNPATYKSITVPASTWLLVSTGYSRNPSGTMDAKTTMSTVKISPLDSGAVASVWNHIFITAPLVPNVCQVDFGGNNTKITSPIYVIGNLCLSGQNVSIEESPSGQPVDMMVGGKLVLSGSGSKVGTDATHKITSGVVVGGCTTVSVASTTSPCAPLPASPSFNYWVTTPDTFVPNDAPSKTAAQQANDYASFDPGPMHTCQAGVVSPGPPLADSVFDNAIAGSGEPDLSGSSTAGGSFELAPNSSYSCISKNGSSVGQLTWNNATKALTVNGSIFIDGNLTISQIATYTGTAVIEVAGTITFNGNSTTLCATSPCSFTNWQGTSGNTSMLTLVALKSNATSITFSNNSQTFQGSLWTQPSSKMTFVMNGVSVEGPISVGSFDNTFNNATFQPLPVIKNMPVGAPVPPNTSASVGPLIVTK
jgi:Tfp pilus assembly protein PilX